MPDNCEYIGMPRDEIDTPVLLVDLDALEHNIAKLADHFRAAGKNLRPHTKSHKTPAIAGSPEAVGTLKIDLSKLFGQPEEDALHAAVRERDEQLVMVGRQTVGMTTGIPKRQEGTKTDTKDDLDDLIDEVDSMEF